MTHLVQGQKILGCSSLCNPINSCEEAWEGKAVVLQRVYERVELLVRHVTPEP